jgi:hypothetical protein
MISNNVEGALPLPARGERVGVRGTLDRLGLAESPPHPALRADLSPQAGRGKQKHRPGMTERPHRAPNVVFPNSSFCVEGCERQYCGGALT